MDGICVYSYENNYFLLKNNGKKEVRLALFKGRYKGTFHLWSKSAVNYVSMPWLHAPLDQCTPHPEYCNIAWLLTDYELYWLIFYDKRVVSNRFMANALTSMEDIQKVALTGRCPFIEELFHVSLMDNGIKHINMFANCDFYTRLLEG